MPIIDYSHHMGFLTSAKQILFAELRDAKDEAARQRLYKLIAEA